MAIIATWAATRGLQLGEKAVLNMLGWPSFEQVVSEKLDIIDQKLDILIQAPFRQARMHFLEGNIEKCKDKLIEAISLNELDLPATFFYSLLLYESGNISLALDYFELVIRKFGPQREIVSDNVIQIYTDYINEDKPLGKIQSFCIPDKQIYYPAEITCNLSSIIIKWKPKEGYQMTDSVHFPMPRSPSISVYDWAGNWIKDFSLDDSGSISAFTPEYLVISYQPGLFFKKDVIEIFRTKDGSKVNVPFTITAEGVAKLFHSDPSSTLNILCSKTFSTKVSFAGAVIKIIPPNTGQNDSTGQIYEINIEPERS